VTPQPKRSAAKAAPRGVRRLLGYWARYYRLSPRLVKALAWQESGFQPHVRSGAGAWAVRVHGLYPETRVFVANVMALKRRFA
jgi:soluble lytic murein transglycosylase-like protein